MSWPTVAIGDISNLVTKGTTPTTMGRPFTDHGIRFVKAEALNGDTRLEQSGVAFIEEETHQMLKRSILEKDDVLITIAGAQIGRCGYVTSEDLPANTNQAVGIVRVNREKAVPRFVYYFFKQPGTFQTIQSIGGGQAAQPNLNLANLKQIALRLPSMRVQQIIASSLSAYDDLIENNRRRMALLEETARLLYRDWFVRLCFPGHEHTRITDGVPEGWAQVRVDDFGTVLTGKTPATKDSDNYGGDIPFVKTPDMHGHAFVLQSETYLTEKGAKSQANKFLPPGALLVSCIGTVGVVSLTSETCQFNQQINAVIPNEDFLRYYCYY